MTWEKAEQTAQPVLKCPPYGRTQFDRQKRGGWTLAGGSRATSGLILKIRRQCGLELQFSAGRGMLDFD